MGQIKPSSRRPFIGRQSETALLLKLARSKQAEFIAIYGRRRVGKTALVRHVFQNRGFYFEATGQKDASYQEQLENFGQSIERSFSTQAPLKRPQNWKEAFQLLTAYLEPLATKRSTTVFLDELPWLSTPRSGLIQALDWIWNTRWSQLPKLSLLVCGSAASWILENLVHAQGGLHNRLTRTLCLQPFSLGETREYLQSRSFRWKEQDVLATYLVMGGIPHYLRHLEPNFSPTQNINRLCFRREGLLFGEFKQVFSSLFDHAEVHEKIIRIAGKHPEGLSRADLLKKSGLDSGGRVKKYLDELEASGFIQTFVPFGNIRKKYFIKVVDEYVLFYLHWIDPLQKRSQGEPKNYWHLQSQRPAYLSWAGFAFERVCWRHQEKVITALRLESLARELGSWRYIPAPKSREQGAQIDLLIDRFDDSITLCEIKYRKQAFRLNKQDAEAIKKKMSVFEEKTKTKKNIQVALISPWGVKENTWSQDLIQSQASLKDLW